MSSPPRHPPLLKGTIPGLPDAYQLDSDHIFPTGQQLPVCGNTAAMLGSSWMGEHFEVVGDMSVHRGAFDCHPGAKGEAGAAGSSGGACCVPQVMAASDTKGGMCCPPRCC